jgi:predicted DNA-binding transcriptional regulator YafY
MERSDVERIARVSMAARLVLRIRYRSGAGEATQRDIEVRDIQGGYCRAWCHLRHEMRTFRMERIVEARMLGDGFMPDSAVNRVVDGWLAEAGTAV